MKLKNRVPVRTITPGALCRTAKPAGALQFELSRAKDSVMSARGYVMEQEFKKNLLRRSGKLLTFRISKI